MVASYDAGMVTDTVAAPDPQLQHPRLDSRLQAAIRDGEGVSILDAAALESFAEPPHTLGGSSVSE